MVVCYWMQYYWYRLFIYLSNFSTVFFSCTEKKEFGTMQQTLMSSIACMVSNKSISK